MKSDTQRDRALFLKIAGGDRQAYKELFACYFDELRENAYRMLNSTFWAEEVAQEVFLQVWNTREKLPGIEAPGSWLYRMSANKSLDRLRRQKLETRAQYFVAMTLEQGDAIDLPRPVYDFGQLKKIVKEAIDQLPAQQRTAYVLQLEEDLSYQEIAARMGLSPNTVRNHLVRAVPAVRLYLQKHAPDLLPLFVLYFG